MIPETPIGMGQKVRCLQTNVEGIVTSMAIDINNGLRIGIQPVSADNKLPESFFTDAACVEILGAGISDRASPLQESDFVVGQSVEDKVSGYSGSITMLQWFMNGCQYALVAGHNLYKGKSVSEQFPCVRLQALAAEAKVSPKKASTGGPITRGGAR